MKTTKLNRSDGLQMAWLLLVVGCCMTCATATAQMAVAYEKSDSLLVEQLLEKGQGQPTLFFARRLLGVPYVAHTLEVGDEEQLVVNLREMDCTTFVETVVALAICANRGEKSFAHYVQTLAQLRYRKGAIDGYTSRLHYFTDWIIDKQQMGLVQEIDQPNPPFKGLQTLSIDYMSKHPQAYKALAGHRDRVAVIAEQEKRLTGLTFRFIPKREVKNTQALRRAVKDGDIIAITCSKPGLDIAHLGFAVWGRDGLHLLNASQLHRQTVEEPMTLRKYLSKHPSHTGIRVVRLKMEK